MRDPQRMAPSKYLAAFALTTLIFVIGMLIGDKMSQAKLDTINTLEREIRTDVLGTELQYRLILDNPCNLTDPAALTSQLYEIGSRLDFMENQLGKDDSQVLDLKEFYSMLEIQHWLLLKQRRAVCKDRYDLILYFYSNLGDCPTCEQQGHVLNYLHDKYPKLNIYSFDVNIENPVLQTIKDIYKITTAPTLVIDDHQYIGFMDSEQIEQKLTVSD